MLKLLGEKIKAPQKAIHIKTKDFLNKDFPPLKHCCLNTPHFLAKQGCNCALLTFGNKSQDDLSFLLPHGIEVI